MTSRSRPERFEELAAELEAIADRLADLAMDLLREGLADGSGEGAALATRREKLLNRARSSVAKAMSLIQRAAEGADADAGSEDPTDF